MSTDPDMATRGTRLKELRTGLGLYQRDFAERLATAGITLIDGKLDQPTISEMERGKTEIPDEVFAAIEGGLIPAAPPDQPPPPGRSNGQRRGGGRGRGGARRAPAPPAAAPPVVPPPAAEGDELDREPETDDVLPGQPPDREPRPAAPKPVMPVEQQVAGLEAELVKLFKGADFLIPVEAADGSIEYAEGSIPGLAQIAGAVNAADGRIIEMHAENMAAAWAQLARENATVRRFLMALTYGGAWRGVLMATAPVAYSIMVNHGLIPNVLGTAPPQAAATPPAAEPIHHMAHVPVNPDPPLTVTVPVTPGAEHGDPAVVAAMQAQMGALQAELDRREREAAAAP